VDRWRGRLALAAASAALACDACTDSSTRSPAAMPSSSPVASATTAPSPAVVGPSPSETRSERGVVPWLNARVPAWAAAGAESRVPMCRGSRLAFHAWPGDHGSGFAFYVVDVRNRQTYACVLAGRPSVMAQVNGRTRPLHLNPVAYQPAPAGPVLLAPGGAATMVLTMHDRASDCPDSRQPALSSVTVTVAGGPPVTSIPRAVGYCSLEDSSWSWRNATPRIAPDLGNVTARLELPTVATSGGTVSYVVALTDHRRDVRLTPCPTYVQDPGGSTLRLNCAAHPVLRSGETVRFAMKTQIPTSWVTGGRQPWRWSITGSVLLAAKAGHARIVRAN
jgi:Protein of unknown function (DUF4232)